MIELDRILELFRISDRVPRPPEGLLHLIRFSAEKKGKRKPTSQLLSYLNENMEKLEPLLASDWVKLIRTKPTPREIVEKAPADELRNILLVLWMNQLTAAGNYDRIKYPQWQQKNFLAGLLARALAKQFPQARPSTLFLATYLQDFSLLILSRIMPEAYDSITLVDYRKRFIPEKEVEIIETDHGDLSGIFLNNWDMPIEIIRAVRYHHFSVDALNRDKEIPKEALLLYKCQQTAEIILGMDPTIPYRRFSRQFSSMLKMSEDAFNRTVIDVIRSAAKLGPLVGLPELRNISIVRLLKNNDQFLNSQMLSYQEILQEAIKSEERIEELENEIRLLKNQANHWHMRDPVTGLYTHPSFYEFFEQKIQEAIRYEYPLSLILMDIDRFDLFNRSYGYEVGNHVLKQLGQIFEELLRRSDISARYGGDEFAILLPHTGLPQARFVAEKIRKYIQSCEFTDPASDRLHKLTVSAGIATLIPIVAVMQSDRLLGKARDALRKAIASGGNATYVDPDSFETHKSLHQEERNLEI
ncbi:MAG: hypothetical protein Kow0037_00370 [Calditrichia bacterium]